MASICSNNLKAQARANLLCKVSRSLRTTTPCAVVSQVTTVTKAQDYLQAFGIRLVPSPSVVQIAKHNGYDALFIDLEHSTLSLNDSTQLCTAGLLAGITPFVRVPYRCGEGFVQRVLDGGAMGVIFPHIHEKADAEAAVRTCKYPPLGNRSMTGLLPQFSIAPTPVHTIIEQSNAEGSTVFVMIETKSSIENIDEIAATEGVDVLLIGSNDLSIELGVPGLFESAEFHSALEKVSRSARAHGKVMGLAGIYGVQRLHEWAVNELGVRFLLGDQDSGFIAKGAKACVENLKKVQK